METHTIKINIINRSDQPLPGYETCSSAGMDLRAFLPEDCQISPFERKLIPTGIHLELPTGYEAQIRPRSGLALNHGITVLNSPGTIDADYRGEIKILLINLSNTDFYIKNGDRIAQMIISKYEKAKLHEVDTLNPTERGSGGYGHTGLNGSCPEHKTGRATS